jgi:hypothetical protein
VLSLVLCLWAAAPAEPLSEPSEDCDAIYYGDGRPKDDARALACYRSSGDWAMVAVMQLNGEGTPVDVAGARETFQRMRGPDGTMSIDAAGLDRILKGRETNPRTPGAHIDFCEDVRGRPWFGYCARREEKRIIAKDDQRLAELRAGVGRRAGPVFDAACTAFRSYADAERDRTRQKYVDRRNGQEAAVNEEVLVRANFMARLEMVAAGAARPERSPRSFVEAKRALDVAGRDDLRKYESTHDPSKQIHNPMGCELVDSKGIRSPCSHEDPGRTYIHDYQAKSRTAQRLWIRYRDAMARLATTRWPGEPELGDATRTLITEDRISEMRER